MYGLTPRNARYTDQMASIRWCCCLSCHPYEFRTGFWWFLFGLSLSRHTVDEPIRYSGFTDCENKPPIILSRDVPMLLHVPCHGNIPLKCATEPPRRRPCRLRQDPRRPCPWCPARPLWSKCRSVGPCARQLSLARVLPEDGSYPTEWHTCFHRQCYMQKQK